MATPERDIYTNDGTANRTVYTRESNATGWFVGIIVALALLAIAYLVFTSNPAPTTETTTINNTPAVEAPVVDNEVAPMTDAAPATEMAPAAPTTEDTAPAAPAETAPAAPATDVPAAEPAPGA